MSQIICIGSASKDIFFPTEEGVFVDTPDDITSRQKVAFEVGAKYQIEDRFEAVGGVAANAAQGLARLGLEVACYSCVGGDALGEWVVDTLQKEHVSTDLILRKPEAQTDLSAILVFTQNGERTIFFNRDANELLLVEPERIKGAEWVFVSALNGDWKRNMRVILDTVRTEGIRLAMNPGQRNMKDNMDTVAEAVKQSDVLVLNKDEAIEMVMHGEGAMPEQLLDESFLLQKLFAMGAKSIALTDGVRGAWGYDGNTVFHAQARLQKVVDSTGAGDAFGSGFFAALVKGFPLEEALRWGIANSASVVCFYGAKEGLLNETRITQEAQSVTVTAL